MARTRTTRKRGPGLLASALRMMGVSHAGASTETRDLAGWAPQRLSADADILPDQAKLVARARDLDRNSGVAKGGIQTIVDNVVGTGLRLSARPRYRLLGKSKEWAIEWGRNTEEQFASWYWSTSCHAGDTLTGDQITAQVFRGSLMNGEALGLPLWIPGRDAWSTKIQTIESDRLGQPPLVQASATERGGIRFDSNGMPLGYWIRKRHPGDINVDGMSGAGLDEWEFIPRRFPHGRLRVLHVFDSERSGQSRGIPLLTSVLPHFKQADRYTKAELDAAVANALIAAVIETPLDPEEVTAMLQDPKSEYLESRREHGTVRLESGLIASLFPGDKLTSFLPARPATAFDAFVTSVFRQIGIGLGLPLELLMKDFSKTNYTSAMPRSTRPARSSSSSC